MPVLIGAGVAVLSLVGVFVAVLSAILPGSANTCPEAPHGRAPDDIPSAYLRLYLQAGQQFGIGWHILAAIGKTESDHGRGQERGITSGTNSAGAAGPMQFMPGTWAAFGVDGDRDGHKDIYDPADAIPAAARYLKHNGAPRQMRTALYRYNHSRPYVEKVLRQAKTYAQADGGTNSARCLNSGHLGTVAAPSRTAAKAIAFARTQLGKPYVWGAEGPNSFDCSGLTFAAYQAAGITIPRVSGAQWRHGPRIRKGQEQPGDLVFFNSGPGTSTNNPGHVGLVVAPGKMIAAPRSGTDVQVQSYKRSTLLGFTRPTAPR